VVEDPRATLRRMEIADVHWSVAIKASADAPPDAAFAERLRAIAQAATGEAAVLNEADAHPNLAWSPAKPKRNVSLSYELRPGGNRPGSPELWNEFDATVQRLSEAQSGEEYGPIVDAFHALADVLSRLADSVDEERGVPVNTTRRQAG
jgi:hypothetical protein